MVVYENSEEGESELGKRVVEGAWRVVCFLAASWLLVFGIFLLVTRQSHRHTFFTTETGRRYTILYFLHQGATEHEKAEIFVSNHHHWREIRDDVREWVEANWSRWQAKKPAWMTQHILQQMETEEMIPAGASAKRATPVTN